MCVNRAQKITAGKDKLLDSKRHSYRKEKSKLKTSLQKKRGQEEKKARITKLNFTETTTMRWVARESSYGGGRGKG